MSRTTVFAAAIALAVALAVSLAGCSHATAGGAPRADTGTGDDGDAAALPPFIVDLIARMEAAPPANPPASIHRYDYRGDTVYYVPPRCCDVPSALYSATGERICSPDGGFTGRGDGKCPDFLDTRSAGTLIWADGRQR
ncbi:DUF6970 domain-containing protein [Arenimonas composti]|uniref:DUF6970 domain-containing protein n=1 Tax=Arenimonas composti TR7-09 = DSM 18010 TaxID=1121013 RepID=A0A091BDD7_9GAMM|nr:hypothetical protein [Arenimonas composti]KFN49517.1 hypothetical protein P873_10205 [Arenimonas composti TR7-09 = DSM 18010]